MINSFLFESSKPFVDLDEVIAVFHATEYASLDLLFCKAHGLM